MIADLDAYSRSELPDYDLVIVGSGPAGMTVANELRGAGLRICLLESGIGHPTRAGDLLRHVESDGIHIKEYSRERALGGASTTWAGLSSPLDAVDMEERPFLRSSGWPLESAELQGYYEQAAQRYRFPSVAMFGPEGFGALRSQGDCEPVWSALDEKIFMACAEPQNFAKEWSAPFADSPEGAGYDIFLNATVQRIESAESGARITSLLLRTSKGRELRISARTFVIATGGIENARLMLASQLGNDQVGRWMMNHPKNYHGMLHLAQPVEELPYYFGCLVQGFAGYAGLRLPLAVQRERKLLNSYVRLEPIFPWTDNDGIESLVLFVKKSAGFMTFWRKRQGDQIVNLRDYSETGDDSDLQNERHGFLGWLGLGLNVLINLPRVLQYLYFRLSKAKPKIKLVRIRNFMEMEPDPRNRITLSDAQDAHGQAVPHVQHQSTELDRRSLLALHAALVSDFESAGLGRFESSLDETGGAEMPWPIDQDASHHMGTTRMGTDEAQSVVDADCRVHGIENLYMAGASVFPTSGCVNPTFTIVALSIRLAQHLRNSAPARSIQEPRAQT